MPGLPLAGRRVLVTRAAHQAGKLSDGLRTLGAIPVEVPVLEIVILDSLDTVLRRVDEYDWVIFTSANTVRAAGERSAAIGVVARSETVKVAAVGAATATAAREAGWNVVLVPENYVAEGLVAALGREAAGKRVLLARAEVARDVIPDALRVGGAIVDVVDAYRNVIPEGAPEKLRRALRDGLDAVTFTSSSSVTHLADVARAASVSFPFVAVPAISIGPITSQTLRESGWEPAAEAGQHDVPGLLAATERVLAATR
ncbi:MAG TPA: uroporphyrinogen-III synthase [Terracidiphilus sp.]|nr:uroporphyrinogen-III synthase [Terracidiphilus sp.]